MNTSLVTFDLVVRLFGHGHFTSARSTRTRPTANGRATQSSVLVAIWAHCSEVMFPP